VSKEAVLTMKLEPGLCADFLAEAQACHRLAFQNGNSGMKWLVLAVAKLALV